MSTVDQLKSLASSKLGFARTNNFLVELPPLGGNLLSGTSFLPEVLGAGKPGSRELNILCKNATIPGKQILTHDRRIGMRFEKVAYGFAVGDVNMTFFMLNDYGVMNYFDAWRASIVDEDGFTVGYKNEYAKPVRIHQLRKPQIGFSGNAGPISVNVGVGGGSVYSVELEKAFPTTIGQIDFSNDLDGLVELSVSFSYTNWRRITPSQNFINVSVGI